MKGVQFGLLSLAGCEVFRFDNYLDSPMAVDRIVCEGKKYTSMDMETFAQFTKLKTLVIKNTSFTAIPAGLGSAPYLSSLIYEGNRMTADFSALVHMTSLLHLSIVNCSLTEIPPEVSSLKFLNCLDLSGNSLAAIPQSLPANVRCLHLKNNRLTSIPATVLNKQEIEYLDLEGNSIQSIPAEIRRLKNLISLNMANNRLETGQKEFRGMRHLERLDLSQNNLAEVIDALPNLISLRMASNRIKVIPNALCRLEHLRALDLSNNEIASLPRRFGKLQSLRILKLSSNALASLCDGFDRLEDLVKLDLSSNRLSRMPVEIGILPRLRDLKINNNRLQSLLPSYYDSHSFLERRFPGWNPISSIRRRFQPPPNIERIQKGIFRSDTLVHLNANNNSLAEIPDDFHSMTGLCFLYLSGNRIRRIPASLNTTGTLQIADFSNNDISAVPHEVFENGMIRAFLLNANFIPRESSPEGLGTESLRTMPVRLGMQFTEPLTIEEAITEHRKEGIHWNVQALNSIRINPLEEPADGTLVEAWERVLKYFVKGASSSDAETVLTDRSNGMPNKIDLILGTEFFTEIVQRDRRRVCQENGHSLRKRVSEVIQEISNDSADDSHRELKRVLRSYLRPLFSRFLDQVIQSNGNESDLESVHNAVTNLCEHSLVMCYTGKLEGVRDYYAAYCLGQSKGTGIEQFIRDSVALLKERAFSAVMPGDDPQNVHRLSSLRPVFADVIGIAHDFDDPFEQFRVEYAENKKGDILRRFLAIFSVDRIADELLAMVNSSHERTTEALHFLKSLADEYLRMSGSCTDSQLYRNYNRVIKTYFEYTVAMDTLVYTKLKRSGIVAILRAMRIAEIKSE